jgi:hypothetical protein
MVLKLPAGYISRGSYTVFESMRSKLEPLACTELVVDAHVVKSQQINI